MTHQSISFQQTILQTIITCSKHWLCLLHDLSYISPMVQMQSKMIPINEKKQMLLHLGKRIMLSCNLWVQSRLVNGALGVIMQRVYTHGSSPHKLLVYVVMEFDSYNIGSPRDQSQPKYIPIPPINRGNKKHIPLHMDGALNIHKSNGLTFTQSTINIVNNERQGLAFIVMP